MYCTGKAKSLACQEKYTQNENKGANEGHTLELRTRAALFESHHSALPHEVLGDLWYQCRKEAATHTARARETPRCTHTVRDAQTVMETQAECHGNAHTEAEGHRGSQRSRKTQSGRQTYTVKEMHRSTESVRKAHDEPGKHTELHPMHPMK